MRRSPKPGGLDRGDADRPPQFVDHQGCQGLPLDVFGDYEQRLAQLRDLLEHRHEVAHVGDLLVVDQQVSVLEIGLHALLVGDEVGRKVAAVELHAFDDIEAGVHALGFLDGDHPVLAHLVHRVGDEVADVAVVVRRGAGDLGDLLVALDVLGRLFDDADHRFDGGVDAALDLHRVGAGGDVAETFAENGLRQHGGCRSAVAGDIAGLGRDFANHLRTHVLERILELDFLGDGHPVLGDRRRAELLVEHDVATLGTQGYLDGVGERIHSGLERFTGRHLELQLFGSHGRILLTLLSASVVKGSSSCGRFFGGK